MESTQPDILQKSGQWVRKSGKVVNNQDTENNFSLNGPDINQQDSE